MSMSALGLTGASSWRKMALFSKARTTCTIASHCRMFAKNLLPKPSPLEAPATNPAISTNVTVAGRIFSEPYNFAKTSNRSSGTGTIPVFGSIVAKG